MTSFSSGKGGRGSARPSWDTYLDEASGKGHHITPRVVGAEGVEPARGRLLESLQALFGDRASPVSVVFDPARAPKSPPAEEYDRGLHIYYALREEADDLIEELIRREAMPQSLAVVSD